MIKIDTKEVNIQNIFQYCIAFFVVFGSADTVYIGANNILRTIVQLVLCLVTGWIVIKNKNISGTSIIYAILSLSILMTMIVNNDYRGYTMWLVMLIGLFVSETIDFEDFIDKLDNIIFVIACLSLLGSAVLILFPKVYHWLPLINQGRGYKHMYFMVVNTNEAVDIISTYRNYGVFREPAMFCIYLGISLARQCILKSKASLSRIIILLLTIYSTKSMTGYVAASFLYVVFLLLNRKNKKVLTLTAVLGGIGAFGFQRSHMLDYIIQRFDINGASRDSVVSRVYSVLIGLNVGKDHFWLGAGATKSQKLFEQYAIRFVPDTGVCWANMITYLFASFGIIFICTFLIGIWGVGMFSERRAVASFVFLFFFSLLLCGEIMTYSPIMYILMMYGWKILLERGTKCLKLKYHC